MAIQPLLKWLPEHRKTPTGRIDHTHSLQARANLGHLRWTRHSVVFDDFVCVQMRTNVEKTTHCVARAAYFPKITERYIRTWSGVQVLPDVNTCCVWYTAAGPGAHKRALIRFQFVNYWEMKRTTRALAQQPPRCIKRDVRWRVSDFT